MHRRTWLATFVVVLLGACTSSAPTPPPTPSPTPVATSPSATEPIGVRVAVVLPPTGSGPLTAAGTRIATDAIASRHGDALGEVRTVVPDPGAFVADVATLLAEQGYDLVCVVGGTAADVVLDVAASFPATRFCGVPAPGLASGGREIPPNVLLVDVRVEEAAYLAGVAAAVAPAPPSPAPQDDEGPRPPPAGMIGDPTSPWTTRQSAGFVAGLASVIGSQRGPRLELRADAPEEVLARATEQYDAGIPVVYVPGGMEVDSGVLPIAAAHEATAIVHRDRARFEGDTPEAVLVWFLLDVTVALDLAVSQAVQGWQGGGVSVGVAEGAVRPQAGGVEGATSVFARVREAADGLRDGTRTVPAP